MSLTVAFNVGGTSFTTVRETLLKEPSSKLALITKNATPCVRDSTGGYFIDRDPKYFQLILNFLRDGWCLLPISQEQRRELLQEIRYYQLAGFEGWLRAQEALEGGSMSEAPSSANYVPAQRLYPLPTLHTDFNPQAGAISASSRPFASGSTASPNIEGNSFRATASYSIPKDPASSPAATGGGSLSSNVVSSLRDAFLKATALKGPNPTTAAYSLPLAGSDDGGGWTSRYLLGESNTSLREMINTLLELAFVPPHRSLHSGKAQIAISSPCDHLSASSLLNSSQHNFSFRQPTDSAAAAGSLFNYPPSRPAGERSDNTGVDSGKFGGPTRHGSFGSSPYATGLYPATSRNKTLDVEVRGSSGWTFAFTVRPASDAALWDKYDIASGVQDNWFVLGAILKDQFGIMLEEEPALLFGSVAGSGSGGRPDCMACRRSRLSVTLTKMY